jgi:hypothetical protein
LGFPGKILADPAGGRLFISDSGRHRVLELDLETRGVRRAIGSGIAGLTDGLVARARFRNPQGLALRGELLYVAEPDNHLIREVDLVRGFVRTLAGTGEAARGPGSYGKRTPARSAALSSPWDLSVVGDTLFVAMAGCNQVWRLDLDMEELSTHAGSGVEGSGDGKHDGARFAWPTGIATDGRALYVADGANAAVRRLGLGADGEVVTLLRSCGSATTGRLAPMDIAWRDGCLVVACPQEGAIRILDLSTREVRTLCTGGSGGAFLSRPGGVDFAGEFVYVSDTDRHRILRVRRSGGEPVEWKIASDEPPETAPAQDLEQAEDSDLILDEIVLAAGTARVHFDLRLPRRYDLNRTAPFELTAYGDGVVVDVPGGPFQLRTGDPTFPVPIPVQLEPGIGSLRVVLVVFYCEAPAMRLCYYQSLQLRIPIRVTQESANSEARAVFSLEVPSAPI